VHSGTKFCSESVDSEQILGPWEVPESTSGRSNSGHFSLCEGKITIFRRIWGDPRKNAFLGMIVRIDPCFVIFATFLPVAGKNQDPGGSQGSAQDWPGSRSWGSSQVDLGVDPGWAIWSRSRLSLPGPAKTGR